MPPSRTFAAFEVDLPDDIIWSPGQERVLRPRGRNVVEAICRALHQRGHSCTEPEQFEDEGWSFGTRIGDARVWGVFLDGNPLMLGVEIRTPFLFWLSRDRKAESERLVTQAISGAFNEDGRFRNVQWIKAASASAALLKWKSNPAGTA